MTIKSDLISGAGNTFHVLWRQDELSENRHFVTELCKAFPADGVVFLKKQNDQPDLYEWNFYNNDGSLAEMCGNATRCVGYYVENFLHKNEKVLLETVAGPVKIISLGHNTYETHMTETEIFDHPQYFYCNTGVPHVVIEMAVDKEFVDYKEACREIRHHPDFINGTNVTLIRRIEGSSLVQAVSFERGVEDFTLACGTGAVAAGLFMRARYAQDFVSVEMPGGVLEINVTHPSLPIVVGPAEYIKECDYEYGV